MTVETSIRSQEFAGGQGNLDFSFKTIPNHPEHIKVTLKLISTGSETELTYNTHYTVTLNTDGIGGTVTILPTYGTEYTQTVWRDTTKKQESDYDDYNQFPADTLENDLDRLMCLTQEVSETVDRCIKNPITNPTEVTLEQIAAYATTCETQAAIATSEATTAASQAVLAEASADAAAASAASINIPTIATGDAGKYLKVKSDETGYDHVSPATQLQAEVGSENTLIMTPLRVKQAITSQVTTDVVNDTTPQLGGTLDLNGHNVSFPTTVISDVLDEDNMYSDSDTKVATQQSIKAYVSSQIVTAFTAGNIIAARSDSEVTTTNSAATKVKEIQIPHGGTLRLTWEMKKAGGSNVNAWIYRNGVEVGTQKTSSSTSYVSETDDVSGWSEGDLCQLYINAESGGTAYAQLFEIKISETNWGFSVIQ